MVDRILEELRRIRCLLGIVGLGRDDLEHRVALLEAEVTRLSLAATPAYRMRVARRRRANGDMPQKRG